MVLNSQQFSCFNVPYAEIVGMHYHTWIRRLAFKIDHFLIKTRHHFYVPSALGRKKITGQCFPFKYLERSLCYREHGKERPKPPCYRRIITTNLYEYVNEFGVPELIELMKFTLYDHLLLYSPFLGVAFLLMDAKECISTEEIFLTKIEKFINIHQNSFLVLFAPLHGPEEWNLMFRIHQRYGRRAQPRVFVCFVYTALFTSVPNACRQLSFVLLEDKLYNLPFITKQADKLFLRFG